ncbi:MAG: hypothetical protein HDS03_00270 [Bacteroides sp.]|nr:hypothetical protein [Bacteroides sp.]
MRKAAPAYSAPSRIETGCSPVSGIVRSRRRAKGSEFLLQGLCYPVSGIVRSRRSG